MLDRSSVEWPGMLKWAAIGFSSFLLRMSLRRPLRRMWVLRLSHVLQFVLPALDEVDDVSCFVSCRRSYVEGTANGGASESVFSQNVLVGSVYRGWPQGLLSLAWCMVVR